MSTLTISTPEKPKFVSTRNACKLCAPLGACLAYRGVEGAVPFLHGSQGCATYIRRYMISHFKEPMDIASSSFSESSAVFGGESNFRTGIQNVEHQYNPSMIGIATTCLSETIGEDVPMYLNRIKEENSDDIKPHYAHVSTPSYRDTHAEGFQRAIRSIVEAVAKEGEREELLNIIIGMHSPADIRYLKEILDDFSADYVLLPDYSDTMDGPAWDEYFTIPEGGTPLHRIEHMGRAEATVEFGSIINARDSAGGYLREVFGIPLCSLPYPIGIEATDRFFHLLETVTGNVTPENHRQERGRLVDSYVDAHKYLFGKRAVLYGEECLVAALAEFCMEIGITPILCASGGKSGQLEKKIMERTDKKTPGIRIMDGVDFMEIEEAARQVEPDIIIGNSKGYKMANKLEVPLVRVGFPIHDRIGGARIQHLGYRGTQHLFDRITNQLLESMQNKSSAGYFYL